MGLLHITPDGDAVWHCAGRDCEHHNCADPLDNHGTPIGCEHHKHLPVEQRPAGTPLTAHMSHEDVQWTRGGIMIALPECGCCGTQLFAKCVFTDEELAAPNLTIPEYEEYQESVVDKDEERLRLALLKHGIEIDQVVHIVKQRRVVGSHPHPMVARHQELARQLIAAGKVPMKAEDSKESQGKIEEAEQPKGTKRRKKTPRE
jgi:hypothetical protein